MLDAALLFGRIPDARCAVIATADDVFRGLMKSCGLGQGWSHLFCRGLRYRCSSNRGGCRRGMEFLSCATSEASGSRWRCRRPERGSDGEQKLRVAHDEVEPNQRQLTDRDNASEHNPCSPQGAEPPGQRWRQTVWTGLAGVAAFLRRPGRSANCSQPCRHRLRRLDFAYLTIE